MSKNHEASELIELKPRIVVIGVGGAGGNAINNMIASGLTGVEYVAANTDAQALVTSSAERRLQLGVNLTEGLGAGSKPEIGEAAAEEAIEDIRAQIQNAHMVFIAAGMGGGTGTGAAAVIARAARDMGILTVGIVTKPFQFEGTRRMRTAESGIVELRKYVDTLIVIPNQNLFRIATEKTTFAEAFVLADRVLYSGVACIVDLIVKDGLINLDFADVRTVMSGMGTAMMGTGEASGERRAFRAAEEAISNPLLDEVTLKGAKGVLLSIIGGPNMTLYEVDEAASRVRQEVDPDANIIVGATFDDQLDQSVRVAIVASGLSGGQQPQRAAAAGIGEPRLPPALPPQYAPSGMPVSASNPPPATAGSSGGPPVSAFSPVSSMPAPARNPFAVSQSADAAPHQTPRELWRGPGNVVIEEAPSSLGQPPPVRTPQPPPPLPPSESRPFVPSPPEDVHRPMSRRVPDLEDFPPVGQREYRAKTAPKTDGPSYRDHAAQPSQEQKEAPVRGGLLHRMIGSARRSIRQ